MNEVMLEGTICTLVRHRYSTKAETHTAWFDVRVLHGRSSADIYVIAFGEVAKFVRDNLDRDLRVIIMGHLTSYQEDLGEVKRRSTQVVADEIEVIGEPPSGEAEPGHVRVDPLEPEEVGA